MTNLLLLNLVLDNNYNDDNYKIKHLLDILYIGNSKKIVDDHQVKKG